MNALKNAEMVVACELITSGGIGYGAIAPSTWDKQLLIYHEIENCRSWLQQSLKDLVDEKFLTRRRRWNRETRRYFKRKGEKTESAEIGIAQTRPREIWSLPSLWALTEKGCRYLISKGVHQARKILNDILRWKKKGDKRWPTPAEITPSERPSTREEALAKIGDILKGLA